jgi:hypothetical protein
VSGALQEGRIQEIFETLAESYAIARKLGILDDIAHAGALLAQILALGGRREQALQLLDETGAAFHRLGDADGIAHVRTLRDQFSDRSQRTGNGGILWWKVLLKHSTSRWRPAFGARIESSPNLRQ